MRIPAHDIFNTILIGILCRCKIKCRLVDRTLCPGSLEARPTENNKLNYALLWTNQEMLQEVYARYIGCTDTLSMQDWRNLSLEREAAYATNRHRVP